MKRIIDWLETKFSRHSAPSEADECGAYPDYVENHSQGKDASTPDSYACDDTVANRQLSFLNKPALDAGKSVRSNPYNTGRFDTSKAWDSGSRK